MIGNMQALNWRPIVAKAFFHQSDLRQDATVDLEGADMLEGGGKSS